MLTSLWGVEAVVVSGGEWCVSNASMRVCVCACVRVCVRVCVLGGAGKLGAHRGEVGQSPN